MFRIDRLVIVIVLAVSIAMRGTATAAPANCPNMLVQAISASAGVVVQARDMIKVCSDQGWTSGPCLTRIAVVAQATAWLWWTTSQWYCTCTTNPNPKYCAGVGLIPAPPKPDGGGGGLPPAGPALPKPLAANLGSGDINTLSITTSTF